MSKKGGSGASEQSNQQMELMREQIALQRELANKPPTPNPPMYGAENGEDVNAEAASARRNERRRLRGAVNTGRTLLSGSDSGGSSTGKTLLGE